MPFNEMIETTFYFFVNDRPCGSGKVKEYLYVLRYTEDTVVNEPYASVMKDLQ